MYLPLHIKKAVSALENSGFTAFAVGGCVRDFLLNKQPFDYDITTNATPDEIKAVFKNEHSFDTGIKHGTVTVLIDGASIEITTFRIDLGYDDNRHPKEVAFTSSLEMDLARRDFTVNAMAYSEKTGIVDVFGGKSDLEHRIIRTVGNADLRFNEDALRIIRALRFAAVLGFEIEEKTAAAIHENSFLLKNVSVERFSAEFVKLICGESAPTVLEEYIDVISVIIPELSVLKGFDQHHFRHDKDLLGHILAVLKSTEPTPVMRLAALFHDIAKPICIKIDENGTGHFYSHAQNGAKMAEEILSRLKFDSETKEAVTELILHHEDRFPPDPKNIKHKLNKLGKERFEALLALMQADEHGKAEEYRLSDFEFEKYREIELDIIKKGECFSLKDLAVNGRDLTEAGIAPSPKMGEALDFLLCAVIDEKVQNNKNDLLDYLFRCCFNDI